MEAQPDFKDLLKLFNVYEVEYMIVDGYALAFYGAPRFTGDMDIFVKPSIDNAKSILKSLDEFGFGLLGLTESDFTKIGKVVQLGVPPIRIDIITSITGVEWESAVKNKTAGSYGDIPVYYIGLDDFIKNKSATGRSKDIADIDSLTK